MFSRLIHVIGNDRISFFLRLKNIPMCVCLCVCVWERETDFFIHLSVDGYLDCFQTFAIVSNAATNMEIEILILFL